MSLPLPNAYEGRLAGKAVGAGALERGPQISGECPRLIVDPL